MSDNSTTQDWEQVIIEVDSELADQVAALLEVILPQGGVVREKNYGDLFPHELDQFQGPVRLYGYYPSELSRDIQQEISNLLKRAGQSSLLKELQYSPLEDQNWATAWQKEYRPIPIGERLVIVPTWLENPYPDRIPIWMDPGMAFGSGTHPTTRICLALVEKTILKSTPKEMIDIGCGSGILTIAAVKLGVRNALGLDIDPDAIQISDNNAQANGIFKGVSFQVGSIQEIISQKNQSIPASLVIANIIAPVLQELFADGMGNLVKPGGMIILSGILQDQLSGISLCLAQNGFEVVETIEQEEWVGLIAAKGSVD
jgi:ribosomal protein L11 methyltransferase